jgi:hypothetical protein
METRNTPPSIHIISAELSQQWPTHGGKGEGCGYRHPSMLPLCFLVMLRTVTVTYITG